jgi:signal transduction histidine kinase/AraC-like DNA-binding protein/AmiR/NasT family two-component response regulator
LGSSFGLSKFSKSKLKEFEDKNKAGKLSEMNVYFKNYTYEDGFLGIGCNTSAILEANDGKIWIGANDLLTVFHQRDEAVQDTIPPDIQLQHIALFNEKIQWSDLEKNMDTTIVLGNGVKLNHFRFEGISQWYYLPMKLNLAYKNNFPTFNFIGITMNQPQKVRYQYKLEGFDQHWSGITSHTEAPYGNLPQGNYVFKVKAMNSLGYWSKEYNYAFTVRPPWWKTWWAYSFYALFVSGIIYILFSRQRLQYRLNLETLESEKLKEVDQLKTRFFANISHEFRTPLTLILGQIDSLKTTIQEQRQLGQLDIADRNARRLLELINQLLDLSKLEARSMVLQATEKDVVAFMKSIFFSMQLLADKKQIQLFFESDNAKIPLYFDPDKLEKIYTNLLSNAWKFTPEGGAITTTISTGSSDYITIGVSDTGAGIPEDSIPLLFDRFYQVDSSLTRRQQGTGIGLALVKELVDLHHGHIQVRSRVGEGSTFSIRLPVGRAHLSTAELMPAKEFISGDENWPTNWTGALEAQGAVISQFPEVNVEGNKRAQTTVLVVEDNPDVRAFIAESLRTMGNHHILQASNGREGLERAREVIPDLILTDVMMPEMDGITFSRLLRADELTSHIPVIMLTAKSGEEEKIEGLQTGIDDYLTKPFNARELLLRVNNLIKIRRELRRRFSSATVIRPAEVSSVSVDQIFLKKVIGIIEANIPNEQFGVEPLSAAVNMSVTHLNRKLNALIDQTAGHLIRSMRMQRAADLLLKNVGNVSEIAYMVGFSVPENFSRSFKQQFNCTPLEYQRNGVG